MFYSLSHKAPKVDFKTATIQGQAPDGGLYFPEEIPVLNKELLQHLSDISKEELAFQVIQPYVGDSIPEVELKRIVRETIDFPIPLKHVYDGYYALELFHGPTLAFKDVGARFMSRCLGYFARENKDPITVLVATSGDTGGAVASGFHKVEGVRVVILYPSGKVSSVQEKQLTTFGDNIHALEVDGNFDDCQQLVKQAFRDEALRSRIFLTSANSINIARWLPQQFYYFFALQQWKEKEAPVFSVPSGNFGNICAGIMAWKAGLPVKHFIAACNANDVVPRFLETGEYHPLKAIPTISNAMDVGDPSNFVRILEIFGGDLNKLKSMISSYRTSDDRTREIINTMYHQHGYLPDPHGAVGFDALSNWINKYPNQKGIVLETAHPIKFLDVVEPVIQKEIPVPASIEQTLTKPKNSTFLPNNYSALTKYLSDSNPF